MNLTTTIIITFLYNSIISIKAVKSRIKYYSQFNKSHSDKKQNRYICNSFKKLENSISEIDKTIENILKYSTKNETINTVLKRIGSKKYKNSLKNFKNSIKKDLYKEKISQISENTNELIIQPNLLGKLFSNFIFDGDSLYCKNLISVGYVILRIIGHKTLDYKDLHIFLRYLFFHLISKGFGINSFNEIKKVIAMKLAKKLYVFLVNYILKIEMKVIQNYWKIKMTNVENINELVDNLFNLICLHLNFLELSSKGSISNNFLATKSMMEKWFMVNKDNFSNQDFFFQSYVYILAYNLKKNLYNTDLIFIKKKLNNSLNIIISDLDLLNGINYSFIQVYGKSFTNYSNIFTQDWVLDLSQYINDLGSDKIKYLLKPYQKFANIFIMDTITEEPEAELEAEKEEENYVAQKTKKQFHKAKVKDFGNKFQKISDLFTEKKQIFDHDNIITKQKDDKPIVIPEEKILLKKTLKHLKSLNKKETNTEESPSKLIKL